MEDETVLTIDDVFEIALKLEADGAEFYRTAARHVEDANVTRLLETLADTEETHSTQLTAMRKEMRRYSGLGQAGGYDELTGEFVRSWAKGVAFDLDEATDFGTEKAVGDVLRAGIEFEHAARDLYLGFKDIVPVAGDVDWLTQLIKDEEAHAASLKSALDKLQEQGLAT